MTTTTTSTAATAVVAAAAMVASLRNCILWQTCICLSTGCIKHTIHTIFLYSVYIHTFLSSECHFHVFLHYHQQAEKDVTLVHSRLHTTEQTKTF